MDEEGGKNDNRSEAEAAAEPRGTVTWNFELVIKSMRNLDARAEEESWDKTSLPTRPAPTVRRAVSCACSAVGRLYLMLR